MSETNACPHCGAEHDREQGQFTFWKCGTWRINSGQPNIVFSDKCMSTATASRAERLEAALNRIYITAEPGSLIRQIAADALRV